LSGQKDYSTAFDQSDRSAPAANQATQLANLFRVQFNRYRSSHMTEDALSTG